MSEKAQALVKESKCPKYYFSFAKALKSATADKLPDTPYTSSVSLVMQLRESLRMIKEEGIENVWSRHARLAEAVRIGVKAMGLELFATGIPNDAVTAVKIPAGLDPSALVKQIRQKYGIFLVGGQGKIKEKIFRIGHLGYAADTDVILAITAVEMTLKKMGHPVELGRGVRAVEEYLMSKEQ
jgi:aspartate aminotransferase-like enzyme